MISIWRLISMSNIKKLPNDQIHYQCQDIRRIDLFVVYKDRISKFVLSKPSRLIVTLQFEKGDLNLKILRGAYNVKVMMN